MRSQPQKDRFGYQWTLERGSKPFVPSSERVTYVLEACLGIAILLVALAALIATSAGISMITEWVGWLNALPRIF